MSWRTCGIVFVLLATALPPINRSLAASRPATAADCEILRRYGVTNCTVNVTPYDPDLYGVGQAPEAAKRILKGLPRQPVGGSQCASPTDDRNIDKLTDAFVTCAAQFLQDYTNRYGRGSIVITSAYRSNDPGSAGDGSGRTANQCAGGVPNSNHAVGIAMDVRAVPESTYQRLWTHASNNPQFGVCFPFQDRPLPPDYPNGDRPHMVLAGGSSGEAARCAQQGVRSRCSGTPDPGIVRTAPPVSRLGLSTLGNTSLYGAGYGYGLGYGGGYQPPLPPQPLAGQQGIFNAFNPMPQPVLSPIIAPNTGSGVISNLLSPPDTTSTQTNTGTTAPIVISGSNSGTVISVVQTPVQQPTSAIGLSPIGQNTFTSNTQNWQGPQPVYNAQTYSRLVQLYSALRDTLAKIINFLRPGQPVHSGDGSA